MTATETRPLSIVKTIGSTAAGVTSITMDNAQVLALANFVAGARSEYAEPLGPALAGACVELDRAAVQIIQAGDVPPADLPPALFDLVAEQP